MNISICETLQIEYGHHNRNHIIEYFAVHKDYCSKRTAEAIDSESQLQPFELITGAARSAQSRQKKKMMTSSMTMRWTIVIIRNFESASTDGNDERKLQ